MTANRLNTRQRRAKRNLLRERDGDRCWLCHKPMVFGGPMHDDAGATIDHLLPLSQGGRHELGNLKLAHRSCNRARADNPPVEIFYPRRKVTTEGPRA